MEVPVTAKAALLQVLLEGPGYGTELAERVQARTGGKVILLQGSIYPALEKFEHDKIVKSYVIKKPKKSAKKGKASPAKETVPYAPGVDVEAEVPEVKRLGGRPRVYYALTEKGIALAEEHKKIFLGLVTAAA